MHSRTEAMHAVLPFGLRSVMVCLAYAIIAWAFHTGRSTESL
jgi:hypothetical protein